MAWCAVAGIYMLEGGPSDQASKDQLFHCYTERDISTKKVI